MSTFSSANYSDSRRGDALREDRMIVGQPAMVTPEMFGLSKAEKNDYQCSQLATRIVGSVSLFVSLLLFAVASIIVSTSCCGDHTKYDESEWEKQCGTGIEDNDDLSGFQGEGGNHSCYHRNIAALVTGLFAILLLGVGATIVLVGECMFSVDEESQEDKLENYARYVKARDLEMRQLEKQQKKEERLARSEARSEISDLERTARINNMRRYSIGNPQTPSDRQLDAMYGERRAYQPQVVQSNPYVYGNSRPYAVV